MKLKEEKCFQRYSEINALFYIGVLLKILPAGEVGGEGGNPPSPPTAPQQPALPSRLRVSQRSVAGEIHAVNDSSGSGTTERTENGCKDDYYNF